MRLKKLKKKIDFAFRVFFVSKNYPRVHSIYDVHPGLWSVVIRFIGIGHGGQDVLLG